MPWPPSVSPVAPVYSGYPQRLRLTTAAQRVSAGISLIVPPLAALTDIGTITGVVRLADGFDRPVPPRAGAPTGSGLYHGTGHPSGRLAKTSAVELTAALRGLSNRTAERPTPVLAACWTGRPPGP